MSFFLIPMAFAGPVYAVIRMVRHRRAAREAQRASAYQLWGPAGIPAAAQQYAARTEAPAAG